MALEAAYSRLGSYICLASVENLLAVSPHGDGIIVGVCVRGRKQSPGETGSRRHSGVRLAFLMTTCLLSTNSIS